MSFERTAVEQENRWLKYYTDKANYEQENKKVQHHLFHLSLYEIGQNLTHTIIAILTELSELTFQTLTLEHLGEIFLAGDRVMYLGILVLLIALTATFFGGQLHP